MNNNRLKFRGWDKHNYRMWEMVDIDSRYGCSFIAYDTNGEGYEDYDGINIAEDVLPLQCTGLKDIDGKYIYEGDILEYSKPDQANRARIVWDDPSASFNIVFINSGDKELSFFIHNDLHNYRVIGNIYQNQELLEGGGGSNMTNIYTVDFLADPNWVIVTCHTCNVYERIAATGTIKGISVLIEQKFIDRQLASFRKAHDKAHIEEDK